VSRKIIKPEASKYVQQTSMVSVHCNTSRKRQSDHQSQRHNYNNSHSTRVTKRITAKKIMNAKNFFISIINAEIIKPKL